MQPIYLALLALPLPQDAAVARSVDRQVLREGTPVELRFAGAGWEEVHDALREQAGTAFSCTSQWRDACEAAGGVTLDLGETRYWNAMIALAKATGGHLRISDLDADGPRVVNYEDTRRIGEPVVVGAFCVTLQASSHAIDFRIAAEPWIQGVELVAHGGTVRGRGVKTIELGKSEFGFFGGSSGQTQEAGYPVDPERLRAREVDVTATFEVRVRLGDEVFESEGDLKSLRRRAAKAFGGRLRVTDLELEDEAGRWGVELSVPVKKGPPVEESWLVAPDGARLDSSGRIRDTDGTCVLWYDREDLPGDPSACRVGLSRLGEHVEHACDVSFDGVTIYPE